MNAKSAYTGETKHKGLIMRRALIVMLLMAAGSAGAQSYPRPGDVTTLTTGGTAQNIVVAPMQGCYVTNPLTASDQGIGSAEVVYVNPNTTATANGYGGNSALQPGQSYSCPPGDQTNLSAIAATSGHRLSVVRW